MKLIFIIAVVTLTVIAIIAWIIFDRKNKALDKKILELNRRKARMIDLL